LYEHIKKLTDAKEKMTEMMAMYCWGQRKLLELIRQAESLGSEKLMEEARKILIDQDVNRVDPDFSFQRAIFGDKK
jgi:hypothetical protein